jgi:hypothetical protein
VIKFNKVTWYSKLLAAIFIFGAFPILVFAIGRKYEQVMQEYARLEVASGAEIVLE